jgi:hypothetical protein
MFTGQVIVILSVLFFAIATYAILLSPFLPLTGFLVCLLVQNHLFSDLFKKDIQCPSKRHLLQILCRAAYTHYLLLCYRELGGMAILSQFVIVRKNKPHLD